MGQNSSIEWTHHTFNPWHGCVRVSPGCEHCYAETLSKRWGHKVWGPAKTTGRRMMSADYWKQPIKWNKAAEAASERHRVFCSSMADVFEEHPAVDDARERLWELIKSTPHLDWLLLTKRPENITSMIPIPWRFHDGAPHNVWYGTSVEDQQRADERIPQLLNVPARVRFLSCEPLLGPVDLTGKTVEGVWIDPEYASVDPGLGQLVEEEGWPIHWVIVGGESGHGARPMNPAWARSLRDQCQVAGVAFFMKQWGEYRYGDKRAQREADGSLTFHDDGMPMYIRVGKKEAGRVLDGRTWDEFPNGHEVAP